MQFTSHRKLMLAGYGHALPFEKGETRFVPPILRQEAMAQGLDPVLADGEDAPTKTVEADDSVRIDAIKGAMKAIAERNTSGDFDAAGCPKTTAIENVSGGFKPANGKERLALWAEVVNDVKVGG